MRKQAFTIKYIVSINYLVWPKAPGIQRHKSYQEGYFKSLDVTSQELVKGHSFLWNAQVLNTPNLPS